MKKNILLYLCFVCVNAVKAQAPADYYSAADGKYGDNLRYALENIIATHTQRSYDNLWTDFRTTDRRADGKVWDMYSSITNFTFGTDQAGNYKKEGDVYNREHSFPKSWFSEAKPMYTDLYHLYPTDGYVNNRRSNYPFGEVGTATYTSSGSFSKVGNSSVTGYSGKVFEPADEYKGDFARTYFYMVTCYASKVDGWSSPMLSGDDLSSWAVEMLMRWSEQDPVSDKERARIEAVYGIQHNRNPFIDCPGLEKYIWGDLNTTPVDMETLTGIIDMAQDGQTDGNVRISVVQGVLRIEAMTDNTRVRVFDLAGRAIIDLRLDCGTYEYPLQRGIYLIGKKKWCIN